MMVLKMTTSSKRRLFVDIETFSSADISKTGAFRYMEAPDFDIMLVAFAWDDGPVQLLDLMDLDPEVEKKWRDIAAALVSPYVVKVAHNSAFERAAFTRSCGVDMPPEQWEDTMVLAAYNGLPMSLELLVFPAIACMLWQRVLVEFPLPIR